MGGRREMNSRLKNLAEIPVSEAVRRLNPHLFAAVPGAVVKDSLITPSAAGVSVPAGRKRVKQSERPLMNANERAFAEELKRRLPGAFVWAQAVTLVLANGVRYTPDFVSYEPLNAGRLCFWEVKGSRKIFDGAAEKVKYAADQFRAACVWLVWREKGSQTWCEQRVWARKTE